jgi:dTMP kinase
MTIAGFFVLEGIDGAGTTTQLKALAALFAAGPRPLFPTCEPSDGPVGRLVREALSGKFVLKPSTLAYLFAADREEHLRGPEGLEARLGKGQRVLCDRYLYSSVAYQSIGADPSLPVLLNSSFPLPEAIYFLDIDPTIAAERIAVRTSKDVFETVPFMERVAARYRAVIELYKDSGPRILVLDARLPPAEITAAIAADINMPRP